jgi:SAM-dependent methyltransferase
MPTIQENLNYFQQYEWTRQGDEWSDPWGGPEAQWFGAIYPRITDFIRAQSILEIAPGFGRWTQYLKNYCENLTLVDLSNRCIETCKERFAAYSHINYHVNDGRSLSMIPDRSIEFVFSFDSLVHVEADVMGAYLDQLAQKLTPHGVGFSHHSNIGAYPNLVFLLRMLPLRLRGLLMRKNILVNDGWRAHSMSATVFERLCEKAGLQCISQELINWQGDLLIDCFSTFTLKLSRWSRPNRIIKNPGFMEEAELIKSKNPKALPEVFR